MTAYSDYKVKSREAKLANKKAKIKKNGLGIVQHPELTAKGWVPKTKR